MQSLCTKCCESVKNYSFWFLTIRGKDKEVNMKNNLKLNNFNSNVLSRKTAETKPIKTSVLCCLQVEKINILLECLLPYAHPMIFPICMGNGIQTTVKPNKLLSVMNECRHDFHNGAMTYMLQFDLSAIHIIFLAWVVLLKVIFPCLNPKPDDEFLPFHMHKVFNKTGHCFIDIIIA